MIRHPCWRNGRVGHRHYSRIIDMDRRDFHKWTLAALSGVAAGCAKTATPPADSAAALAPGASMADAVVTETELLLIDEPHVCRGLNACKGLGKGGDNACAGQGACASVAEHACGGAHECKGQAGCGETPGMNACKTEGGCHVPLMDEVWPKARAAFEAAMKKSSREFGAAPAKT
jgi:hypothetical protein